MNNTKLPAFLWIEPYPESVREEILKAAGELVKEEIDIISPWGGLIVDPSRGQTALLIQHDIRSYEITKKELCDNYPNTSWITIDEFFKLCEDDQKKKELPRINRHKGVLTNSHGTPIVKYGCARLDRTGLNEVAKGVELFNTSLDDSTNRKIKSITLDSGVEVTAQELKEIQEVLNE